MATEAHEVGNTFAAEWHRDLLRRLTLPWSTLARGTPNRLVGQRTRQSLAQLGWIWTGKEIFDSCENEKS